MENKSSDWNKEKDWKQENLQGKNLGGEYTSEKKDVITNLGSKDKDKLREGENVENLSKESDIKQKGSEIPINRTSNV